jgi:hypothetical protein
MTKVQKNQKKSTAARREELLQVIMNPQSSAIFYSALCSAMQNGSKKGVPSEHREALYKLRLFFLESDLLRAETMRDQVK